MDCFPCCTRFWNGLFSMLCRHPCRSWFDAWPGSSPSSLASRWCENWTESSPCWGTAGNEARRMWWDMLDWIALADTRMQTVSHACRHTYALSAALRRMLRSSQLNTQLFSCGEICWIEHLLQTRACRQLHVHVSTCTLSVIFRRMLRSAELKAQLFLCGEIDALGCRPCTDRGKQIVTCA